jgi:hydrogenase maturation protease
MPPACAGVLIIGVGNRSRGDDAAGLIVARLVRDRLRGNSGVSVIDCEGDTAALVDLWAQASTVIVADAVRSGAEPGRVHRIDARARPLPPTLRRTSTHAFGIGDAIELARTLGRLPPRLIFYGVESAAFALGTPPSPAVTAAAASVARRIVRAIGRTRAPSSRRPMGRPQRGRYSQEG